MNTPGLEDSERMHALERRPLRAALVAHDRFARRHLEGILSAEGLVVDEAEGIDAVVVALDRLDRAEVAQLAAIRARHLGARIIVVSPEVSRCAAQEAVEAGADGLVLADSAAERLAPAVRAVCAGLLVLPPEWRAHVTRPVLSPRQKQILGMVVMGFTNKEIAGKLALSDSTVKSHLTSVFAKLGVRGRNEATALVLDPESGLGTGVLSILETRAATADPARERVATVEVSLDAEGSLPEHVVYRTFVNETVVLDLKSGRYHGLTPMGGRMLEALDREQTVGAAVRLLAGELANATQAEIERDVCSFCADLHGRGLLELSRNRQQHR
jgi:DNA-binding NarL/FixJ family response regulator